MPGSVIDYEHPTGMLARGIGPGDIAQMARKRFLQALPPRHDFLLLGWCPTPLHYARRQVASDKVERAEDMDHIIAIQVAHDGPVSLDPQCRPQHTHGGLVGPSLADQDLP